MAKNTCNSIYNKYNSRVEQLVAHDWDLESKNLKIEEVSEDYFIEVGEYLPSNLLSMLTEWYLSDTLKSKDVDKVRREEYPVLSRHQIKRRITKQISVKGDTLDYLNITRGRKEKKRTKEKDKNND